LLSVVLYGRNDNYGYNLHKRASLSLNCIAEVLSHADDEIIFVDCNTPDHLPTFPEAIHDILTPRVKKLLRIIRLRPDLYHKYKNDSPLNTLEPLSRNIAIRRHNINNPWILSTNTDMVFVVRDKSRSLSDVISEIPDGFYELPRFEIPEALWHELYRMKPVQSIELLRRWGQRLHLNEVIISRSDILYDGPGDFQLMLSKQLYEINGLNEEMLYGWHVDSNICKRMYMLNGETKSLLDFVYGYHCTHNAEITYAHTVGTSRNDEAKFVDKVDTPCLPEQGDDWGIPNEELEEIRLDTDHVNRFHVILNKILPASQQDLTWDMFTRESYNRGIVYNSYHVFPHLCNYLITRSPRQNIGYCGVNAIMIKLLGDYIKESDINGKLYIYRDILGNSNENHKIDIPDNSVLVDRDTFCQNADIFIFDVGMMQTPENNQQLTRYYSANRYCDKEIRELLLYVVERERDRIVLEKNTPRNFIFIGSMHTWFESIVFNFFNVNLSPYSTHIRHGYLAVQQSLKKSLFNEKLLRFGMKCRPIIIKIPWLRRLANKVYALIIK
jgi:hypothetical protein